MVMRYLFSLMHLRLLAAAVAVLLAAAAGGCGSLRDFFAPGVSGEWKLLLDDIRAYESFIGFAMSGNFSDESKDLVSYPFCGHAPRHQLPWSYQDPAIQWRSAANETECRALAGDDDVFFRRLEAVGESQSPITGAMLAGKLDRFVYIVIHEDCHDQFDLPYGVEEALCDVITHKAMTGFAATRYDADSRESRAITRYAQTQAALAYATIDWYGRIDALYARHRRGEIDTGTLLRERSDLFTAAAQPLAFGRNQLNTISLANNMTYSRYYPQLEAAHDALGGNLARTVAFIRRIDAGKPSTALVRKQNQLDGTESVVFLRAYENAILGAIRAELAKRPQQPRAAIGDRS